jgi:hypothetical protein
MPGQSVRYLVSLAGTLPAVAAQGQSSSFPIIAVRAVGTIIVPELDYNPVTSSNLFIYPVEPSFPGKCPSTPTGVGRVVDPDMGVERVVQVLTPAFGPVVPATGCHRAITAEP